MFEPMTRIERRSIRVPFQRNHLVSKLAWITLATVGWVSNVDAVFAQSDRQENLSARVDSIFAPWNTPTSPGCVLGVSRNGTLVYERGYGMANLDNGIAITPASVFHVASITKQFTAMSILLLAQRGRLSLDDEVRTHITSRRVAKPPT